MSPRTFYRAALLLPFAVPLLLLPLGINAVLAILIFSLGFGGIQYAVFALCVIVYMGKFKSIKTIQVFSYWAPLLFVPIQALGWLAYIYFATPSTSRWVGVWEALLPFAFYTLLIGYIYVGFVALLHRWFVHQGWIYDSK